MKRFTFLVINLLILILAVFALAACFHDLRVMKQYNARLQDQLYQMAVKQSEQSKEIRMIKTDSELIMRMATSGEFTEE